MHKTALGLAVTATLAAAALTAMAGPAAGSKASSCASTLVHYQAPSAAGLSRTPWVRGGAEANAYLLYYSAALADSRVNGSDGAVIYTGGGTATLSTKLLWLVQHSGPRAVVTGKRLDAPGTFTQRLQRIGTGRFQ